MIRDLFLNLGMDYENYDKPEWNPLKDIVSPGDIVLLKPNMVLHEHNDGPEFDLFSVITHPSIVRAVADYAVIALQGNGRIIIGDAPLQTCKYDLLVNKA